MKAIIVNADDFGLDEHVNKGIKEAFASGILSSATILVNSPGFEDAAAFARKNKEFGFGIHLNLTTGKPLTPWIKEMKKSFLKKALLGMANKKAVEQELRSQIQKALDAKIRLTHFDGHHHIHVFPKIKEVVLDLAQEFNIQKIRLPLEPVSTQRFPNTLVLRILSLSARKNFMERKIICPNYFRGIAVTGSLNVENFKNILATLKPGVTEIMSHPGYASENSLTRLNKERELELQTLKDKSMMQYLHQSKIKIINYGDIS